MHARPNFLTDQLWRGCLVLALSLFAGCVERSPASDPVPLRSVTLLNAGVPNDEFTNAEWQTWDAEARKVLATRGKPDAYWLECRLQFAWRIPPCPELPLGGTILDGFCEGRPACEAERNDARVVVICIGGEVKLTLDHGNGGARAVTLWSLPESSGLMLILTGKDWRSGTSLDVVALNPDSGRVETIFLTGGEEDCDELGCRLSATTPPELSISGIRKVNRNDLERLGKRFGISVVLR